MNWHQVEGTWKQLRGKLKEQWGRFTHDQLDVIAGRHEQVVGKIQQRYGVTRNEAVRKVHRRAYHAHQHVDSEMPRTRAPSKS